MEDKHKDLVFNIEEQSDEYCGSCQSTDGSEMTGMKTHKNIPTDTRWVKGTHPDFEEPLYVVMCGDCLSEAQRQGVDVRRSGKKWDGTGIMVLRPCYKKEESGVEDDGIENVDDVVQELEDALAKSEDGFI